MKIKHIKGNTFCIDTGMTYLPFYKVNDEEIIMIDTGTKNERKGIERLLEENGFKVVGILCSHAHVDHAGNNAYFKKKYHCVIAMPEEEARACSSLVNLKIHYNTHDLLSVKEHYGHLIFDTDILISKEQGSIYLCGVKFDILPTPGHSLSHISMITPDDVAYLGDSLISYEVMKGARMPYACFLKEDLESKHKLLNLECDQYVVAHKGIYRDIEKLIEDNIEFYKYRASRIYELIRGSMTLEELMQSVVEGFHIPMTSINKYDVIQRMLKSYLDYLIEIGKVELTLEGAMLKYRAVR